MLIRYKLINNMNIIGNIGQGIASIWRWLKKPKRNSKWKILMGEILWIIIQWIVWIICIILLVIWIILLITTILTTTLTLTATYPCQNPFLPLVKPTNHYYTQITTHFLNSNQHTTTTTSHHHLPHNTQINTNFHLIFKVVILI